MSTLYYLCFTVFFGVIFLMWWINRAWDKAEPGIEPEVSGHLKAAAVFAVGLCATWALLLSRSEFNDYTFGFGPALAISGFGVPFALGILFPFAFFWHGLLEKGAKVRDPTTAGADSCGNTEDSG